MTWRLYIPCKMHLVKRDLMFIWINHSTWGSCQVIVLFNYTILGTWCLRWVTPGTAPLHWKSPVILQYPYEYKQLCLDISLVPNQISQTPLFCLWKSTTKLFLLSSKSVNNNRSEQICPPPPRCPQLSGENKSVCANTPSYSTSSWAHPFKYHRRILY